MILSTFWQFSAILVLTDPVTMVKNRLISLKWSKIQKVWSLSFQTTYRWLLRSFWFVFYNHIKFLEKHYFQLKNGKKKAKITKLWFFKSVPIGTVWPYQFHHDQIHPLRYFRSYYYSHDMYLKKSPIFYPLSPKGVIFRGVFLTLSYFWPLKWSLKYLSDVKYKCSAFCH